MKKLIFVLSMFSAVVIMNGTARADIAQGVKVIVLDAGHGGKDAGAVNGRAYEKDITLQLVLKVGELIENRLPDVKVVYTRKTDKALTLKERSDIAHRSKGDLYLSIHVNSATKTAVGTETCIFSMDESLIAVNRGNGNKDMDRAANYNRNMLTNRHSEDVVDLSQISNDAATRAYINRLQFVLGEYSNALAELIQRNYAKSGRVVRGVKRGPFQVLWGIDMPSVITEVGFLSNTDELHYMTSEKGQAQIAEDIYKAVAEYVGNINKALQKEKADAAAVEPEKPAPAPAPKEETKPKQKDEPARKNEPKPAQPAKPESSARGFSIQIMASATALSADDARFKSHRGQVKCYTGEGSYKYKYCTGFYATREEAQRAVAEIKSEFADAFVIEVDGDRVARK
ncbi:MAG: N-acetylmuramoyl-L-alanine amidase [Alistipes sp.]|nr:N-acetylmuramoyl-L-alanine amidase [Alistipes sp.]